MIRRFVAQWRMEFNAEDAEAALKSALATPDSDPRLVFELLEMHLKGEGVEGYETLVG